MDDIIDFLSQLQANNNREWFNANKDLYLTAKRKFDRLVEELIAQVQGFDRSIGELTVGDCTWRIYRDVRFSADKRPYKTAMGCYFAPGGKRSPFSGYYFEVGADSETGEVQGMLAAGNYYTEPAVLQILREDIAADEDGLFEAALASAKGFVLDSDNMLKRMPRGFNAELPRSKYFLYRNFCLIKKVNVKYLYSRDLVKKIVADFKTTKPFLDFLNRAIAYTLENQ